ncbi:MAG TPA: hypothetical protein VMA33_08960 [Candidatus Tectomicrobia bacterium]|nr:hypothetical protein [Candidatus Tectomicrobia bacterium]
MIPSLDFVVLSIGENYGRKNELFDLHQGLGMRRISLYCTALCSWPLEGAVLFAEIAAPPMNLLGPELVRDLVSLIQRAEADDAVQVLVFKSADPDYFIPHVDVTRNQRVPGGGGEADR